jgi:hypothetical protein
MNWDAAGAIGEILGALAVGFSLLYLARQLQINARQQKVEGHRAISEEFNRIADMWVDLEKTGMMVRAWSSWETASAQEQHIASVFLIKNLNHVQTMYFMWNSKGIDDSVYLAEENFLCSVLASNGGRAFWEIFRQDAVEGFRARINTKLESGSIVPVTEAVPFWNAEKWHRLT